MMSKKRRTFDVFVGNLPPSASEKALSPLFTGLGEVNALVVVNCKKTDGTKIAFVQYLCEPDADLAVQHINGQYFEGRQLHVSRCHRREGASIGQPSALPGSFPSNDLYAATGRGVSRKVMPRVQHLPACTEETLVVCHVKDVTSFYGQRLGDVIRLDKLGEDLKDFCRTAPRLCSETPDFQKMYACQYSDDKCWYRCKVLKQQDNGQSFVQYVDFGNCESVKSGEMVPLKGGLASQGPLALCCRLDALFGIRKDDDPFLYAQAMHEIEDLIQEQCVSVEMKRATASGIHFLVHCVLDRSNIELAEELVRRGYAKVVSIQPGLQAPSGGGSLQLPMGSMSQWNRPPTGSHSSFWGPRAPSYDYPHTHKLFSVVGYSSASTRAMKVGEETCQQRENHLPGKGNSMMQPLVQQSQGKEIPPLKLLLKPHKSMKQQQDNQVIKAEVDRDREKLLDDKIKALERELEEVKNCRAENDFLSKMSQLVELANGAREQRDQLSVNPSHADVVQRAMATYKLCKTACTVPNSSEVKDCLARFQRAQDSIEQCKDKDMIGLLVEERNAARACLKESLTCFVAEADHQGKQQSSQQHDVVTSGDSSAAVSLAEKALRELDSVLKSFLEGTVVSSPDPGLSLDQVHELYTHSKSVLEAEFRARRGATDAAGKHLRQSLQSLVEAVCAYDQKDEAGYSFGNLEACLKSVQHSLSEEVACCKLIGSSLHAPLSLLARQLKKELGDILERILDVARQRAQYVELLASLVPFPVARGSVEGKADMDIGWARVEELVKGLKEKRLTVKQLKSQLRHSLADIEDIESCASPEWREAVEEVRNLRQTVHMAFAAEDSLLSQVATLKEKYYPELSLLFPELEIDAYLAHKGLLKSSWELCAFEKIEERPGIYLRTSYNGAPATIKEYVVESEEIRQLLMSKAVKWSQLTSKYLQPLKAAFVSKDGHKVYLMSPWQQRRSLASCHFLGRELGESLVKACLHALNVLHSAGHVHGAIHPSSILVPDNDDDVPLLDVPNFSSPIGEPVTLNGMNLRAPELQVPGAKATPEGDMYALGCTLLWMCFPSNRFDTTWQGMPSLSMLHDPQMDGAVFKLSKDLLKCDPMERPKAGQLLTVCQFFLSTKRDDTETQTVEGDSSEVLPQDSLFVAGDRSGLAAAENNVCDAYSGSVRLVEASRDTILSEPLASEERDNATSLPGSSDTVLTLLTSISQDKDKTKTINDTPVSQLTVQLTSNELNAAEDDDVESASPSLAHLGSSDSIAMGAVKVSMMNP